MIDTIFFDLDGVLTTEAKGSLTISKNLCAEVSGLSVDDVLACFREDVKELSLGETTLANTWQRICHRFQIPQDEALLQKILRIVPRNEEMFSVARLLSKSHTLGIITDNSRERMDVLVPEMRLDRLFDPIIVSAIEHAAKHDGSTKIFDIALEKAGSRAEESLFIDNQAKNLVTPDRMGMKTYFHDDAKNDMAALRKALQEWGVTL